MFFEAAVEHDLVRESLVRLLEERLERNDRVVRRLRHSTALPDNWRDRAPMFSDEEVLASLDEDARSEVLALRAALQRLDAGTYGICALCGEPIAPGRLMSLPTAVTCVNCAS